MSPDVGTIKQIISNTFEIPQEQLNDGSSSQTVERWDSVGHISLVMALEQEFRVQFTMEEIMEMKDVLTICKIIQRKLTMAK